VATRLLNTSIRFCYSGARHTGSLRKAKASQHLSEGTVIPSGRQKHAVTRSSRER
jgi:hypothetical protein